MSSKHFINTSGDVSDLVVNALEALVHQHPDLALNKKDKYIYRCSQAPSHGVALLSGGGAGHEPAHAAFVGANMLTAAISGNIFASPSVRQILSAIQKVTGPAGALLIIKNYTGDIFHFRQAAEKARAAYGLRVEVVVVADDVAVGRRKSGKVGRRGLAGTVLVHKILGAMAADAATTLDELLAMANNITQSLATIGASLDYVHIPGQPKVNENCLKDDEIELGMGIHNEPGVMRCSPQPTLDDLLDQMITKLTALDDEDRAYVDFTSAGSIILLVNNLGAISVLELQAITLHAVRKLEAKGFKLARVLTGTFMTSLNGPDFSLTLLSATEAMLSFLDTPTTAIGWPVPSLSQEVSKVVGQRIDVSDNDESQAPSRSAHETGPHIDPKLFKSIVSSMCQSAMNSEPAITRADTIVGDGDCGLTLKRGCQAVQQHFAKNTRTSLTTNLLDIVDLVEENMDGTSGALYSLFFCGLASAVQEIPDVKSTATSLDLWVKATEAALLSVQKATPATTGDRTLMDALIPFVTNLKDSLDAAVAAAEAGTDRTKGLKAALGRAVYVNEVGWEQVPDPGAMSINALVKGLGDALASKASAR